MITSQLLRIYLSRAKFLFQTLAGFAVKNAPRNRNFDKAKSIFNVTQMVKFVITKDEREEN